MALQIDTLFNAKIDVSKFELKMEKLSNTSSSLRGTLYNKRGKVIIFTVKIKFKIGNFIY
jgi:hypothetical protein